jgi:hypothetical protein
MYREAERIWVEDEAVMCPLLYSDGGALFFLAKPWMGFEYIPLGYFLFKHTVVEPHED